MLEGPWPLGETIIARVDDDAELGALRTDKAGFDGYAVEALAEPGAGEAFVVAAHHVRDTAGFSPYAEQWGRWSRASAAASWRAPAKSRRSAARSCRTAP